MYYVVLKGHQDTCVSFSVRWSTRTSPDQAGTVKSTPLPPSHVQMVVMESSWVNCNTRNIDYSFKRMSAAFVTASCDKSRVCVTNTSVSTGCLCKWQWCCWCVSRHLCYYNTVFLEFCDWYFYHCYTTMCFDLLVSHVCVWKYIL